MPAYQDFLLDADGDLLIQNGDFVIGLSDEDHMQDLIESFVGWWKEYPAVGVGIKQYQASSGQEQVIERNIKLQLQGDGYDIAIVRVTSTSDSKFNIQIDGTRY
jgi:hypothetical protein